MAALSNPSEGGGKRSGDSARQQLRGGLLLADGAMGTMLGLGGADFLVPEELNLRAPERVAAVHAAYLQAGSRVVTTNTFGASPAKLALAGLDGQAAEINRRAAEIARSAVGDRALVAGDVGPTGRFIEPLGDLSESEALAGFALQAESLAAGGADLLIVETMSALDEARLAVRAAVRTGLPVVATMTFEPAARGEPRTMMGVPLGDLFELFDEGAEVVGLNCGQGPKTMAEMAALLRELRPTARLAAQPNAGAPRLSGSAAVWDVTPADLADFAVQMRGLGFALVGGCCGSTPEHIWAMRQALA
jgi:methionine synthase I (cobalamin-dependent)